MHGPTTAMATSENDATVPENTEAQIVPNATMPQHRIQNQAFPLTTPPSVPPSVSITRLKRQEKDLMPDMDFAIPPEQPWYQGIIFCAIASCLPLTCIQRLAP
jgi:hypothetical protein